MWEASHVLQRSISAVEGGGQAERMPTHSSPSFDEFNFSSLCAKAVGALQDSQTKCSLSVPGKCCCTLTDQSGGTQVFPFISSRLVPPYHSNLPYYEPEGHFCATVLELSSAYGFQLPVLLSRTPSFCEQWSCVKSRQSLAAGKSS